MRVHVVSGYPLESLKGNSVTARRIARLLESRGHEVCLKSVGAAVEPADALVALHLFHSAPYYEVFRRQNPQAKVAVVLTGTDVHLDLEEQLEAAEDLVEMVDVLVAQHGELEELLPQHWLEKMRVIYPSCELEVGAETGAEDELGIGRQDDLYFVNAGHLRAVKHPLLLAEALRSVEMRCRAYSIGGMLEGGSEKGLRQAECEDGRYRWLGELSRAATIVWMKGAVCTVNTSWQEGGANSVIESMLLGVPVLLSDVAGNRGFLGNDYEGYFQPGDAQGLARLMRRALVDDDFLARLRAQIKERLPLFAPEREATAWECWLRG